MLKHLALLESDDEIKQRVELALSSFGMLESIHIFEPSPGAPVRIALITMNELEQARKAATSLGLRTFGHKSLIIPITE